MSKPGNVSLEDFDPVSRHAPRRDHNHPAGIESDHDARILDEIEASLRAMIAVNHGDDEPPARLSDVSRIAAEELSDRQAEEPEADEPDYAEPEPVGAPLAARHPDHADVRAVDERSLDDMAERARHADNDAIAQVFRDPRTPPWLKSRSLEPERVPDPWPPRNRSRSNKLFLRFGLAATGAAVVAIVAIKDLPTFFMEKVRGPIVDLTTNAAAVFNEGKATSLQTRMDTMQVEQDRAPAASLRYAVASADPQAQAIPVKTEVIGRGVEGRAEPRRETVMTPWPSPDTVKRNEPAGWQVQAARAPAPSPVPAQGPEPARTQKQAPAQTQAPVVAPAPAAESKAPAPAARSLSPEEIAMLRKMGDDYIAAGDFAGARAVLERAADSGDSSAAFAIASTYDPVVLARFKVRGLEPDIVKAGFWYERARELGSAEAPRRLQAMMASRGN